MKKILSWVLVLAMLLCSCTAALAEDEKVKIVFQHSMETHTWESMRGTIEQFMIDNPNIEVECVYGGAYAESVAKMMTVHAAALQGDKSGYPTIHQTVLGSLAAFAEGGVVAPLDDLFVKTGFPIDKYFEGMRQAYSYNGTAYGIPSFVSVAPTMYFNKTLGDEAGATVPQTWDEMEAWLEKLTVKDENGNTIRYGLGIAGWDATYFAPIFWQQGSVPFLDDACTQVGFGSEEAIATINMLKNWVDKGYVKWYYSANASNASSDLRQSYIDGTCAAVFHTCSMYSVYKPALAQNGWEVGVAFPPAGVKSLSYMAGSGLTITALSSDAEKEAAMKLILALTSAEPNMSLITATGYLPVSQMTQESDLYATWIEENPELLGLYAHLDEVVAPPSNAMWSQLATKWVSAMAMILQEGADVTNTVDTLVEECNEILADF